LKRGGYIDAHTKKELSLSNSIITGKMHIQIPTFPIDHEGHADILLSSYSSSISIVVRLQADK
jgi:hypothetical protein